jgi:hypothetical protein
VRTTIPTWVYFLAKRRAWGFIAISVQISKSYDADFAYEDPVLIKKKTGGIGAAD